MACSVSRGRYSLGTKLVVTEVSNEAFAFSASGVQNSMSNISMLRKLLIKSLFLANVDNIMAAPAVSFGFIISYAGKEVNRVEKSPVTFFKKMLTFIVKERAKSGAQTGVGSRPGGACGADCQGWGDGLWKERALFPLTLCTAYLF